MFYFPPEIYVRIIVSMLVGLVIGYERALYNKPAGMRTFALVSMGSTLFTLVSIYGTEVLQMSTTSTDPLRITAQIVSGIGFIGAGVIWNSKDGGMKHGVTTAAELWVASAVGVSLGVGMYDLAAVVTLCIFCAIFLGRKMDEYVEAKRIDEDKLLVNAEQKNNPAGL